MPYYVVPELLDGDLPEILQGNFEASRKQFLETGTSAASKGLFSFFWRAARPQPVSESTRNVIDGLWTAGIRRLEFKYDGGNDEGFAQFASASTTSGTLSSEELADRLRGSRLLDPSFDPYAPGEALARDPYWQSKLQRFSQMSPGERLSEALLGLGEEAGTLLLGVGWGTGEYIMTGRFSVDLQTGAVEDLVLDPPPNMRQQFIENFGEYEGE